MANLTKTTTPASQRGANNKQARAAAMAALQSVRSKSNITQADVRTLLIAICQLLGLANEEGKIK
jgi:hypothetical protein